MTENMRKAARTYRLPQTSTLEELECGGFKTVAYGNDTVCIGYHYEYGQPCYYTATYEFTSKKKTTCEDECRLKFVSVKRFEDEGHAIQNALMYRS